MNFISICWGNSIVLISYYFFLQLVFDEDKYFENILRVEKYDSNRTFAKFRQPVNKEE